MIWPACLPKDEYPPENGGIFAGWQAATDSFLYSKDTIAEYRSQFLYSRQVQVEEVPCRDPEWMMSNTYYPQGTTCYADPSLGIDHQLYSKKCPYHIQLHVWNLETQAQELLESGKLA